MTETEPLVAPLADALRRVARERGHLVVITGAGVSLASGVPTFRGDDPDAVWKNDILEKGTYRFFRDDPVESWLWSMRLFAAIRDAEPNAGHRALDAIGRRHRERGGDFTLVTQNIDGLHRRAAPDETEDFLVEVHGRVDRVRCASTLGCPWGAPSGSMARDDVDFARFLDDPQLAHLPRCPVCHDLVRQHVLWFDEYYNDHADYQWERVQAAAESADTVLFVGTSFSVGVTELFLHQALFGKKRAFSVDPSGQVPYPGAIGPVPERSEVALPAVCAALGLDVDPGIDTDEPSPVGK